MLDWWTGLNWKFRVGVALTLILISTVLYFCGVWWWWGWAVGTVLLLFAFPNDAEKRGYHDF